MCRRLVHGICIVCVVAGCARSDTDLDRSVRLLPTADVPHGTVSATLLGQTHTVMEILSRADTAGLGRHLHPEFAWHRFPENTGSPTRLRDCRPRRPVILSWRLTAGGWKVVGMTAAAGAR